MSVYSTISKTQLIKIVDCYALGEIQSFSGIENGIQNSNYQLTTSQGQFIITIFEDIDKETLPSYLDLLVFLNKQTFPCPVPQLTEQQQNFIAFKNKPLAIFSCLAGKSVISPNLAHCQQVGITLARLHLISQNYPFFQQERRNFVWCQRQAQQLHSQLSVEQALLLDSELAFLSQFDWSVLPQGLIHADLFKDNILFVGEQLSAILDFYNACQGTLLMDLAIAVNDWCYCSNQGINPQKLNALVSAYQQLRPLQSQEQQLWQVMLRFSALRFWLSRLTHQLNTRGGALVLTKDPQVFQQILQFHRDNYE